MGIVSEPWGEGKGLVATHYRDTGTGVDRRPGEAVGTSGGPAETRGASGTRRADARGVQGWGRDLARPEDSDDAQAPRVAHRALADVHAREAEDEGGHGLGPRSSLRRHRGEEGPTPRQLGRAPSVGEEPEVADPDEAAREDVEEKPLEELRRRQGHRFQAVSSGVVPPPEAHPVGDHADQPVIGDRHAVGLPVGRQV